MRLIYSVELNNFRYKISSFDKHPEKKPDSIMHDPFNCIQYWHFWFCTFLLRTLSNYLIFVPFCFSNKWNVSMMCWVRFSATKKKHYTIWILEFMWANQKINDDKTQYKRVFHTKLIMLTFCTCAKNIFWFKHKEKRRKQN